MSDPEGAAFDLAALIAGLEPGRHDYADFFRGDALSLGVAVWPAGSIDDQEPHTEDEVYQVAAGRGMLRVGADEHPVGPGSVVYVRAGVEHRFHDIDEDLQVLVFWAPPRRKETD